MARKLDNEILKKVLLQCKHHKSIDFFIALTDLSKQIRLPVSKEQKEDNKEKFLFLVPCANNSVHCLWSEINNKFPKLLNKTTIYKCFKEFQDLDIIKYNSEYQGFEIKNMGKMLMRKGPGFSKLKTFFLSGTFSDIPYVEKRLLLYISSLLDKTAVSNRFKRDYGSDIVINLNEKKCRNLDMTELNWLSVCRTKNIYYVKKLITSLINNFSNIFTNKSKEKRKEKYGKETGTIGGIIVTKIYFFDVDDILKTKEYNEEDEYNLLKSKNLELDKKIDDIFSKYNIVAGIIAKSALLRRIRNFIPYIQELIIDKVAKRKAFEFSEEGFPIRSMDGFITTIIKTNSTILNTY